MPIKRGLISMRSRLIKYPLTVNSDVPGFGAGGAAAFVGLPVFVVAVPSTFVETAALETFFPVVRTSSALRGHAKKRAVPATIATPRKISQTGFCERSLASAG